MKLSVKKYIGEQTDQKVKRWILVIARIYVGLLWLQTGWNKIGRGSGGLAYKENLVIFINQRLESTYGYYRSFLEVAVLPNADLFTILVAWGEFLVGISLFLGLLTRLGAGVAMFLSLNFALLQARALWLPGLDAALFWIQLVILLGAAGRTYGIDYFLHIRFPKFRLA